jgi:ABC-type xylose transport system permease subunit
LFFGSSSIELNLVSHTFAIGGNVDAAQRAGINVDWQFNEKST